MRTTDRDLPPVTGYQWYLLVTLAVATFFEGFDQTIIGLVMPYVARDFGLGAEGVGVMQSAIGVGAVLALFITMQGDRFGRRRMLLLTVVGYALGTGATALARGWTDFVVIQLITRMFLFAELALAVVVIAEEFPAHRRAFGISILLAASVGGGVCAAFALGPAMQTRWEWRTLYVAGLLPLLLVIPLRFGVRETGRYASIDHRRRRSSGMFESAFAVWRAPYRRVLVLCVLLFGLIGALVATFPAFYPYFLATERGFTPTQVSRTVGTAALMGLPAIPLAGWLLDRWGRRVLGVTAPLLCTVGVIAAFNASGSEMDITMVAMASVFVGTFVLPVQMTYIPELFPTRIRSLAASWISNGVGRALVVASPAVTGALAAELGSIGYAASVMAICGLAAAGIVYAFMPETKGLTLENTSSDDVQSA